MMFVIVSFLLHFSSTLELRERAWAQQVVIMMVFENTFVGLIVLILFLLSLTAIT